MSKPEVAKNWQNCFDYFEDILPPLISCLPVVFPTRSVYENYNRKGLNLNEYAKSVESNKKFTQQVDRAIEDIEKICETILLVGKGSYGIN